MKISEEAEEEKQKEDTNFKMKIEQKIINKKSQYKENEYMASKINLNEKNLMEEIENLGLEDLS